MPIWFGHAQQRGDRKEESRDIFFPSGMIFEGRWSRFRRVIELDGQPPSEINFRQAAWLCYRQVWLRRLVPVLEQIAAMTVKIKPSSL
jgi:hypothetical protein